MIGKDRDRLMAGSQAQTDVVLALVLVEYQRQWTERGLFRWMVRTVLKRNNVIQNTIDLTREARALGVPVIHAPFVVDPDNKRGLYAHLTRGLFFRKGSRKAEIDLRVLEDSDYVAVGRTTFNAFDGSDLEDILRRQGITRILISGFATDQCALKTLRSALKKGFDAYLAADCCATFSAKRQGKTEKKLGRRAVPHTALRELAAK